MDADDEVEVRGPFRDPAAPSFQILSIVVDTSAATSFEEGDITISSAEFFARAPGRIVEAEGTWDGTRIRADEVEIEDDDGSGRSGGT